MEPSRERRAFPPTFFFVFSAFACGGDAREDLAPEDVEVTREVPTDVLTRRERIAALWGENRKTEALAVARPLAESAEASFEDVLNAGILELSLASSSEEYTRAEELFQRAAALDPTSPAPLYGLGTIASENARFEEARDYFARALALAPDDYPTQYALANALAELGHADAERLYRELLALGVDTGGSWHLSVLYRLGQLLAFRGDPEAEALRLRKTELEATGLKAPANEEIRQGNFGRIRWPRPSARDVPAPTEPTALRLGPALPRELVGMTSLVALTLHESWDRVASTETGVAPTMDVGPPDLAGFGPSGLVLALRTAGGYEARRVTADAVDLARAFDLDNDGDLDFVVSNADGVRVLVTNPDGWSALASALPELPAPPTDIEPVDFDHEGDIDLLLVGAFGARLWRNDGLTLDVAAGAFVDATEIAMLPVDRAFEWCAIEDLDTDQDVDFLFGGSRGAFLADNLRGGAFADRSADLPEGLAREPVVADLDGDAWPDLYVPGSALYTRNPSGRYARAAAGAGIDGVPRGVDLDLDGYLDLVWDVRASAEAATRARLALGARAPLDVELVPGALASTVADFDGDGALDVALSTATDARIELGTPDPARRSILLALRAPESENRRGLGAIVEVRAGPVYRRIFWTGEPVRLGLGAHALAEVIRVTWPRGVVQHELDVPAGSRWTIDRVERMEGSCPFLYTWNGATFEFVTDVLGGTPLGLPMAPGRLVPPDHDEYVLVQGEQLVPKEDEDGRSVYELQLTEELREVTYLDRVRLEVVDHPADTEVFPNERFSFPPFPEHETHLVRAPQAPLSARDDRGNDWTASLAATDRDFAVPFEPYGGQLTGLARPHTLELAFDPALLRGATRLRLLCTGWFLWSDASANVAAARTPDVAFVPPILQVPDDASPSGWRDAGPPVGFPAGKTKTMVVDVTEILDRDDARLRIFSTLCLYWDSIRLAVDGGDIASRTTPLEPLSARLWQRGFSRSLHPVEGHALEWFDWDVLDEPRWNPHPGDYTRLGETLPLLAAIDDRFVVMGAGDALRVRFDAGSLPPLPDGWRRDFFVFLDGWAKDRDPNTVEALFVEPLPFHGMSAYPYGPDEAFPDDETHRAWRREWQTREATRWIEPLAPKRKEARLAIEGSVF